VCSIQFSISDNAGSGEKQGSLKWGDERQTNAKNANDIPFSQKNKNVSPFISRILIVPVSTSQYTIASRNVPRILPIKKYEEIILCSLEERRPIISALQKYYAAGN
jgi:hypothetical protein